MPLQYYYLHADSVFVGTVSSITNNTNDQYVIKFDLEKSWKGSQHPTITTYSLVACGYSFVKGGKYLVFASDNPPDYFEWATKPFDVAQGDITQINSQQFQTQASTDKQLYEKLVNARNALSNMMGSKMSSIPISSVSVDDLNFTLDVGVADKQAETQSGIQEYKTKIEQIVGNIPITIRYEEYVTPVDGLISQKPQCCGPAYVQPVPGSPLKQFQSGTPALDVKCNDGLQLILKAEDASPTCVKPDTVQILTERGWAWNYANVVGKESISLSAYQGISHEIFYNNETIVSDFTINVNIKNFRPSNTPLVLQVYYNDGILYKTVNVPSDTIQPDGFYKYYLIAVSDKNHPPPFKVVATYNNETAIAYAPVFAHP